MMKEIPFDNVILDRIAQSLIERSETIAFAESVTTGLLQFAFGSVKNASTFYQGGVTVYNGAQKYKHLHV
ncbi:MAG: damage-inducible protein CinA, partial [Pedobacter sp.]